MSRSGSGWRLVKFGAIAECINDRVDDPAAAGVERYVGLEHLETDSLRIRRWGTPDQVESTKLRFRPGDIIFGKRRAYQRKLGVADFKGICSAHAMVLRARRESVEPKFLPFFMLSNVFMDRALSISVGSLSPTISWRTLAEEEFAIPPVEEQKRLATEMWALESARSDLHDARLAGERFLEVLRWDLCTGKSARGTRRDTTGWEHARLPGVTSIPQDWSITRLAEVARLESGHTPSRSKSEYWHGGIPWISLADTQRLDTPSISETHEDIAQLGVENSSARVLPAGTVVLSRTAMIGFTSIMSRPMATSQDFANFVCGDALDPRFLFWLFMGMKEFFDYSAVGSSNVKTIYMPFFQNMQIALPPRYVQEEIAERLGVVRAKLNALREREAAHAQFLAILRESRIGGAQ